LPHLSPPLACAAFVAAGWLLPPVDCFIIRIIIILFTSLRWACLFFYHRLIVELPSPRVAGFCRRHQLIIATYITTIADAFVAAG